MTLFDIDDNTTINLDSIDYVKYDFVGENKEEKVVVVGLHGQSFVVPKINHKEFFTQLIKLGAMPNKQFVSV